MPTPFEKCVHTGSRLRAFPTSAPGCPWTVGYFRESDGELMRCRAATPAEVEAIASDPAGFAATAAKFEAWLEKVRTTSLQCGETG